MTTLTKEDKMSKATNVGNGTPGAMKALQEIFSNELADAQPGLVQGLINLASLPEFDLPNGVPAVVPGHDGVQRGIIGFRRMGGLLTLALACGTAQIQYFPLDKYIAVIEKMNDPHHASINVQNPVKGKDGCGQIKARLNPRHSAIHVIHGVHGRYIKENKHINTHEVYYIPRAILGRYYLASKAQIEAGDQLDSMIAAYDGEQGFSIPLDPLNPELA